MAFLHADRPHQPCPSTQAPAPSSGPPKVVRMSKKTTSAGPPRGTEAKPELLLPTRRGQALQSVSLRLRPGVARALRKVAGERAVDYEEPFTQQGIAEEAIAKWLENHGYPVE